MAYHTGDSVDLKEPIERSSYSYAFTGTITAITEDGYIVRDQDDDEFAVDFEEVEEVGTMFSPAHQ